MARCLIRQNPLDSEPDVPAGTRGHIEDEADGWLFLVDFGPCYGTVVVEASELK